MILGWDTTSWFYELDTENFPRSWLVFAINNKCLNFAEIITSCVSRNNNDLRMFQGKPPPLSMTFVTSFWLDWRKQRRQSERLVSSHELIKCSRSELLFLPISFLFPMVTVCLLRSLDWTSVRQSDNRRFSVRPFGRRTISTRNEWLLLKTAIN